MRRLLLCFAMLPGLFLPLTVSAAPARHGHTLRLAPGADTAPRRAPKRRAATGTLRHARKRPVHLRPTQPVATALIDPVPRGRFPFPPPLKGSHDSLVRQNVRSQEDGLARVQDDAELMSLRRDGELVAVPSAAALVVDERLPANRRYCRAWTAQFLSDLARVHYGRFHRPLQVNSAVRTVEYQRHLELVNGNAAPAEGDDASPHLTGATIDIAKKGLAMDEIGWMRAYLAPLQTAAKIDVEEEFYQSCFHITVYRSYREGSHFMEAKSRANPDHSGSAALLAARIH